MAVSTNSERTPLLPRRNSNAPLSNSELLVALSFTWIGSFLGSLDSTLTTTVSATIASEFKSLTLISWLGSAYLIALAATQPLSGKLSDIFGRRSSLILCAFIFVLGSLTCGLATSEVTIIFGRVLSGIGGGGLNSVSTFTATDLIDQRRRGLWQGFGMIVYGAGLGLGGVVGGAMNDNWGWRSAFLLLSPLGLITACGIYVYVPGPKKQKAEETESTMTRIRRIDFLGASLLILALTLFLCALNLDDSDGGPSPYILQISLPVVGCLLVAFILVEMYVAKEPVIPLHLLGNRTVLAAALTSLFASMSLYTTMFYVPFYFQIRGNTPTQAGLLLVPESIGAALGSLTAGFIMRSTGYCGKVKIVMLAIFLCGPTGFALNRISTPIGFSELFLFFNGVGFGGMLTSVTICLISAIEHEFQAIATGLIYLFRSTGATVGVTLSGALFRKVLDSQTGVSDNELQDCIGTQSDCSDNLRDTYMAALAATFLLAAGYALCALISVSFAKSFKLSSAVPDQSQVERRDGEV